MRGELKHGEILSKTQVISLLPVGVWGCGDWLMLEVGFTASDRPDRRDSSGDHSRQPGRFDWRALQHVLAGERFIDPTLDNRVVVTFSKHLFLLTA
jgi:hypothetical protein